MKNAFLIALLSFSLHSSAQFLQDVSGKPLLTKPYEQYEGSAMLFKDWVKANIVTSKGNVYDDMLINMDVYQDMPVFIRDGKVYTFTEEVTEFSIMDGEEKMNFKKGRLIDKNIPDVFYQVLSTTPLIVKSNTRKLVEVPTYNSSMNQYRFAEGKAYYAKLGNTVEKISLNKEEAQKAFADKWKLLSTYITQNKASLKTEAGWITAIKYYETLKSGNQ